MTLTFSVPSTVSYWLVYGVKTVICCPGGWLAEITAPGINYWIKSLLIEWTQDNEVRAKTKCNRKRKVY